jgi:hypothetical protein
MRSIKREVEHRKGAPHAGKSASRGGSSIKGIPATKKNTRYIFKQRGTSHRKHETRPNKRGTDHPTHSSECMACLNGWRWTRRKNGEANTPSLHHLQVVILKGDLCVSKHNKAPQATGITQATSGVCTLGAMLPEAIHWTHLPPGTLVRSSGGRFPTGYAWMQS